MPRSIAAWMVLIAAIAVSTAAVRAPTDGWAIAILVIEAVGLVIVLSWGILRRNLRVMIVAAVAFAGLIVVETPSIRGRLAIDSLLTPAHDRIGPDREGDARLPRATLDESFSRWTEAHPGLQVRGVTLDDEQATLHWVEPTLGPFLRITRRLLALLPAIAIAVILTVSSRRRFREREDRPCPA